MSFITPEDLERVNIETATILDIRKPEDFVRGSVPGALNRQVEDYFTWRDEIRKDRPVYVMCHTGKQSAEVVAKMTEDGFDAIDVEGGYRAFLRMQLGRLLNTSEEDIKERTKEIERSILKKFRKSIWRPFTRSIQDYQLIQEGDKIACCISGGKDSMMMAKLLQELQRHGQVHFDLVFLCMNPGYNEDNWKIIQDNAKILGIPLTVFESDIFDVVADIDKNPCYLCARMRRGYLYSHAKELGCNKIALGHHFDDVIETILMGMLYGGKVETMMPKLHSTNFEGMQLIRPMYLVKEADICAWRDYHKLHFIQCACRFTEHCATCGGDHPSKRDEMTELIRHFREISPNIEKNIFRSVHNVNLKTIIGYHKGDDVYSFLDDYDERGWKSEPENDAAKAEIVRAENVMNTQVESERDSEITESIENTVNSEE